jgi:phenylpropionate dioxygenase-like ring-hydroxylating dioxygenase large terminal subunit
VEKSSTLIQAACNWKYLYEITIDPLHVPFVHHKTLNKLRPFKPEKAAFNYPKEISSIKDFSGVFETPRDPVKIYPWRQYVNRWESKDVYVDIIIFPNLHVVTPDGGYSFSYEAFYPKDFNNTIVQYVFTTAKRVRDYSYFPVIHLESMRLGLEIYLEDIEMAERLQRTSKNYSKVKFQAKYEGKIYQFRNYFTQ